MRATTCLCIPCHHPLRTISLPIAVIGVALAAIGTLAFLGIFPSGISVIGAYGMMAGGTALATLALLLLCKSICLTNRSLRNWHLPCCNHSNSASSINDSKTSVIECVSMENAYEKMNALELKMTNQNKVYTSIHISSVDLTIYGIKTSSKKGVVWYRYSLGQGLYYLLIKKDNHWSVNTCSVDTSKSSSISIIKLNKLHKGCTPISL